MLIFLVDRAPERGEAWDAIEKDYEELILPGTTHWQHPSFFAFFPSNVTFEGIIADMYAAATNNPGFNWAASPSVTELEFVVVDWLAKMFGLSPAFWARDKSHNGGGVIYGSASEACLTAAIAAREHSLRFVADTQPDGTAQAAAWRGEHTARLVVYGTTQTHTVGSKAALILGVQFRALEVYREDDYGLRGATLQAALDEDRARGLEPFLLVATYGSTSSCAVDCLEEIAPIVRANPQLWLHVDAAYAGVTLALQECRPQGALDAINSAAHSFSLNLHKWGLAHIECSPFFVRDRAWLTSALTSTPVYLRTKGIDDASVSDLRNMQIVLGRRFRALKVWFVLRSYGQEGFREHLRHGYVARGGCADSSIRLGALFEELLTRHPAFELATPTRWGLVVFRLRGDDPERTKRLYDVISSEHSAEIMLTPTTLPHVGHCIRFVVGNDSTQAEHVEAAVKLLHTCADALGAV